MRLSVRHGQPVVRRRPVTLVAFRDESEEDRGSAGRPADIAPILCGARSEGGSMDERNGTVRLVESRKEGEGRTLVATVSRADVQEALSGEQGPVDLLLDVERVAADGAGRETGRIA